MLEVEDFDMEKTPYKILKYINIQCSALKYLTRSSWTLHVVFPFNCNRRKLLLASYLSSSRHYNEGRRSLEKENSL